MQLSFSQSKSRADRFFEKGDYLNAAKYYELKLEKKQLKKDIQNIAICYYNLFEYDDANYYLSDLVKGHFDDDDKTYDNEFNFKYYQVQSALGNYEKGLDYLKLYRENNGKSLNKELAIEVIETIKLKNPDYLIKEFPLNTEVSDFGAVKFKDSVYFVSDRDKKLFSKSYKWTHRSFLDIYSVKISDKLVALDNAKKLPKTINSKLHEGNFCFSKDGKTMYVSRSNSVKGKNKFNKEHNNDIHLYKSVKTDGKWSTLEKLPFNKNGFSYQHPALSPKGDKLYFSSNQDGGFGSFDLYYVVIKIDGFGEPINLGETINTKNREHFPFISDKGNLFFSSNGHFGLGMLDNFVSEKIKGKFTKPINLGVPINSKYDDFNLNYYNEKNGFFATNRNENNDNIFSFKQIGEIFIREYINTFEIRDDISKKLIANCNVVLLDKDGQEIYNNKLGVTASFNSNLLPSSYSLKVSCNTYKDKKQVFKVIEKQHQKHIVYLNKLPPVKTEEEIAIEKQKIKKEKQELARIKAIEKEKKDKQLALAKLKKEDPSRFKLLTDTKGPKVVEKNGKLFFEIPPIYFDFEMWNIRKDSKLILNELAKKLERYPNLNLKINSYTDSRGTKIYNQVLSERRAEATRNYLALETYINARRFKFEGFGESKPIYPCKIPSNCTENEHQINRRSEFEIIEY